VFRSRTRDRTFPRRTLALAGSVMALAAVTAAGAMAAGPVTAGPVTAGPVTSRPVGGSAHPSGVLSVAGRGSGTRGTVALAAFARPLRAADVVAAGLARRFTPRQIAWFMLKSFGWTTRAYPYLSRLWARESGWNTYASNPSGAYGIPQAMPGSKMASAGGDWRTNPRTQIRWGLRYIKAVYGSPSTAWLHELRYGWY
jgi:Transglycosylase SLT domain